MILELPETDLPILKGSSLHFHSASLAMYARTNEVCLLFLLFLLLLLIWVLSALMKRYAFVNKQIMSRVRQIWICGHFVNSELNLHILSTNLIYVCSFWFSILPWFLISAWIFPELQEECMEISLLCPPPPHFFFFFPQLSGLVIHRPQFPRVCWFDSSVWLINDIIIALETSEL